jgi:hypothetical protein
MRLLPRLRVFLCSRARGLASIALVCALAAGCAHATQTYALLLHRDAAPSGQAGRADKAGTENMLGSLSVERIQSGQRVVVLQLTQLPPPERIAPGLREFVVWLEDARGAEVNLGTLHYDRAHHSGNLLATTELSAFTVRVTGERDARTVAPSAVVLAERRVVLN